MNDIPLAQSVLKVMQDLIDKGEETGLQVSAYFQGRLLLNLAAGKLDRATDCPVTVDTLFPVYSVTKGITATIAHILVERGIVSYDMAISEVWPEFACNGKEKITLRQALSHSCGLPLMPVGLDHPSLADWETMCSRIAALAPAWAPGSRIEYHPITYGWIVGETLRRADGRAFPDLLREEICEPLGLSDLHVGIREGLDDRIAIVEEDRSIFPDATRPPTNEPESIPWWLFPLDELMNKAEARRACIPATSGIMTAHAIARHYAGVLPGGVDGVELLPPSRMRLATEPQYPAPCPPDYVSEKSLGYQTSQGLAVQGGAEAFGHGGHGGSSGFADPVLGLAIGIAKNSLNKPIGTRLIADTIRTGIA